MEKSERRFPLQIRHTTGKNKNMKTLLKNGTLVTGERTYQADLLISGKRIEKIEAEISAEGAHVIDVTGMLVFPGFIDAHTHFDMDNGVTVTADDFDTGTRSAVAGGTTTILDFATQARGKSLTEAVEIWHKKADGKSHCNYGFHVAITEWNSKTAAEMETMTALGITSYKVYLAYDALRLRDQDIFEVLSEAKQQGAIVGAHCENGDLVDVLIKKQLALGHFGPKAHPASRPDVVEAEAVGRFLTIAGLAKCPVNIVHMSSEMGMAAARLARQQGTTVYVETCPQYLLLEDTLYASPGFEGAKYVISPPLRKTHDREALWTAISTGEVDTVATDHCAFNYKAQKELGKSDFSKIPNGAPGVQARPSLLYTYGVKEGLLSLEAFCRLLSENPAKLYGMYPQKGCLFAGSDADIVVWNPKAKSVIDASTQLSACDYTPFEGMNTTGEAAYVFVNGVLAAQSGIIKNTYQGEYIARKPSIYWR